MVANKQNVFQKFLLGLVYWFLPVSKNKKYGRYINTDKWKCQWGYDNYSYYSRYKPRYLSLIKETVLDRNGEVIEIKDVWSEPFLFNARQHRKLTTDELNYWNKIPKFYQDAILAYSPEKRKAVSKEDYY